MSLRPVPRSASRARRLTAMRKACETHGFELTGPRDVVLQAVVDAKGHPTADEVHALALRLESGIGRATVYRTLDGLARIGVLTKASHTGSAVRYDAFVERHHHLVCLGCDRIVDVSDDKLDRLRVPDASSLGFVVQDVQVQLRGLCRACAPGHKPA